MCRHTRDYNLTFAYICIQSDNPWALRPDEQTDVKHGFRKNDPLNRLLFFCWALNPLVSQRVHELQIT
jgi:hypothetical protein